MAKTAFIIASWLASAVVIGHAYREFPGPLRFDEAIVNHARFEEALAKQERWNTIEFVVRSRQ